MGKRGAGSAGRWREGGASIVGAIKKVFEIDDDDDDDDDDTDNAAPQQHLELPIIRVVSCLFESTAAASINRRERARR